MMPVTIFMERNVAAEFEDIFRRTLYAQEPEKVQAIGEIFIQLDVFETHLKHNGDGNGLQPEYRAIIEKARNLLIRALIEALDVAIDQGEKHDAVTILLQNMATVRHVYNKKELITAIKLTIDNFDKLSIGI